MRTSSYEVESSKKVFFSSSICNIFGDEKWRCQRYSINKWLCSYVSIDFVFSNCIKWDFSEIVVLLYILQTLPAPSFIILSLSKSVDTKRDLLILEISSHFLKEKKCCSETPRTKLLVMVKVALVLFVCSTSNSFERQIRFQLFCCSRKRPIIKLSSQERLATRYTKQSAIKRGFDRECIRCYFTFYNLHSSCLAFNSQVEKSTAGTTLRRVAAIAIGWSKKSQD